MTKRQEQLLAAIINEFIETAGAVGSVNLTDKYQFNVSPATVRNEMSELARLGYLMKTHSSSGRVPTSIALRYFIEQLLEEYEDLDVLTKQKLTQELHSHRFEKDYLIRNGLQFLTEISNNAAVALIGREIYYAGLSEILNVPEFQELEKLKSLLQVLENYSTLQSIFDQRPAGSTGVQALIGTETGLDSFADYAVVFSDIKLHGQSQGYIAIIGPYRMNYSKIIPAVRFVANSISDAVKGW
jgi:transcriptional regulator of heat shock response